MNLVLLLSTLVQSSEPVDNGPNILIVIVLIVVSAIAVQIKERFK